MSVLSMSKLIVFGLFAVSPALSISQSVVSDWDAIALHTIVNVGLKPPSSSPVYFAYVDAAVYDAVNSINHRHRAFAVSVDAPRGASVDAAVIAAALPMSQSKTDGITVGQANDWGDNEDRLAQMAELHELHATFHGAASVHDPVNGDSPAVITQRIRDMLAIWAKHGKIALMNSTAAAGNYIGNGDPDDPETCPPPSGDTSPTGQQGTLCTFFKYVGGSFQQANKFVALTPTYKTKFVPVRDDDGRWKSSVYFECHYFDVSLDPATGLPLWIAKSHISLDGEARKIHGRWLLTHVSSSAVPVPVP